MSDVFIHPHALCESQRIGAGTRIWAFAHLLPGAQIGSDCNICDHVFIENDVVVGDRVTIKCGVQLWDGLRVGDDVFIGPNATFTNDKFPRSKQYPNEFLRTVVEKEASIGANATILPGIVIGRGSMVGAGAVVTRNVPGRSIVAGNPATIIGYVNAVRRPTQVSSSSPAQGQDQAQGQQLATTGSVPGVTVHRLQSALDLRGRLTVGEFTREIPFLPARYFLVGDVPNDKVRGEHAHRECAQFLICARGKLTVLTTDGLTSEEIELDNQTTGLLIPPMVWAVQYKYSHDALLLVFASHPYDPADYIRDFDEYLELTAKTKSV